MWVVTMIIIDDLLFCKLKEVGAGWLAQDLRSCNLKKSVDFIVALVRADRLRKNKTLAKNSSKRDDVYCWIG